MTEKKHADEWSALKTKMRRRWKKLSDADLKKVVSLEQQIADILEKKYKYTKKAAFAEAADFFSQVTHVSGDYHTQIHDLKNTIAEMTDGFIEQIYDTKEKIPEMAQEGEEKLIDSIKEHPLSSLGIVAAAGFILGSIITK